MRSWLCSLETLVLLLAPAASLSAADVAPLHLTDPGLPLQELRPLDRHVYVLTLEGAWKQPATMGISYYVNMLFPNGDSYSHRVLDDGLFRTGEVRCVIPEYVLIRNKMARGGKFTVVVSARRTVTSATATDVVSDPFEVRWPLNRSIVRWLPRTRHSPPLPIDSFPLPGQTFPTPKPPSQKVPPTEQLPVLKGE